MGEPEPMTLSERRKYLRLLQPSYRSASRRERSKLLDEAQRVTRQHRKSLIRLLRSNLERKPRSRPRGRSYGPQVEYAVRLVARTLDFPCAERLQPALVSTASSLAGHGDLELSADLLERLERISISTVGRMVQRALAPAASAGVRRDGHQPRLARTRPSPPNPLTRSIPAGRLPRHLPGPGYFEADLVHHAGNTTAGQYVHTLQLIDVATGWSERVAILGRSYTVMQDAFERILARLPFPILELHPDNGGEFFNRFLLTYWKQAVPHLTLSRSRPFHKNDNPLAKRRVRALVHGRTARSSAATSASPASTPSPTPTCSTRSTTACGSCTTSSTRSCASRVILTEPPSATTTAQCPLSTAYLPPPCCHPSARRLWPACAWPPIRSNCATRFTPSSIASATSRMPGRESPRMSAERSSIPLRTFQKPPRQSHYQLRDQPSLGSIIY